LPQVVPLTEGLGADDAPAEACRPELDGRDDRRAERRVTGARLCRIGVGNLAVSSVRPAVTDLT